MTSTRTRGRDINADLNKEAKTAKRKVRISTRLHMREFYATCLAIVKDAEENETPVHSGRELDAWWKARNRLMDMHKLITVGLPDADGNRPSISNDHIVLLWLRHQIYTALTALQHEGLIEKIGGRYKPTDEDGDVDPDAESIDDGEWHTIGWLDAHRAEMESRGGNGDRARLDLLLAHRRAELLRFAAGLTNHVKRLPALAPPAGLLTVEGEVETEPGSGEYEPAEIVWEDEDDDNE